MENERPESHRSQHARDQALRVDEIIRLQREIAERQLRIAEILFGPREMERRQ